MKFLFFFLLLFTSINSFASGKELLQSCTIAEKAIRPNGFFFEDIKQAYAIGYCYATVKTYRERVKIVYLNKSPGYKDEKMIACPLPENVTDHDLIRVLVRYLQKNPQHIETWEAYILETAFSEAFPCKLGV